VVGLILAALCELYSRLLADPETGIPKPGYCAGNAVVALEIGPDGRLLTAVPLGTQKGKRTLAARLTVPERAKRSSGDTPNFLCDNVEYILGIEPGGRGFTERARERHGLSRTLHEQILRGSRDDGARAVLAFFEKWDPHDYPTDEKIRHVSEQLEAGGNIVFRLAGDDCFLHERPGVRRAWEEYRAQESERAGKGQCLVTGRYGPIARLHKSISGVSGAQPTGASLVSFNFDAAESYGKKQGENSPVGEDAAFAYGTALNWLTSNERHHVVAGDTTIVFWAERAGPEENMILDLFSEAVGTYETGEEAPGDGNGTDEVSAGKVKSVLQRVTRGQDETDAMKEFDQQVRFYILGLAPNAGRLSVRFWHVNTFGGLIERVRAHFDDMAVDRPKGERPVSIGRLLLEAAPSVDRKRESIPQVLVGSLIRSVLEGTMYPHSLYAVLIGRIRSDFNDPKNPRLERKITYPRAAFIKAHLKRKARITGNRPLEEALTEMLNPDNKNKGYLLGRLFALFEKAQQEANPEVKATIKDRYYAAASATPATVFPILLRLAQHHIAKAQYGGRVDKLIEGVMADIDSFPTHLNLDEQGLFALGYYQQRSALYQKAEQ
jgi:CRISPR-associated protein Csd1